MNAPTLTNHDEIAHGLLVRAGYQGDDCPGALPVAKALGQRVVWREGLDAFVLLTQDEGVPVIALRPGLSPESTAWAIWNGLAGFAIGSGPSELDRLLVAAALAMPRAAFAPLSRKLDGELASIFAVPVAAVVLRREHLRRTPPRRRRGPQAVEVLRVERA